MLESHSQLQISSKFPLFNLIDDVSLQLIECLSGGAQGGLQVGVLRRLYKLLRIPVALIGLHLDCRHSLLQDELVVVEQVLLRLPRLVDRGQQGEWN